MDTFKSQRHTRSGAGRGVSQANGAAIHLKLTELCQHEIVSGILKKWKQCGTVQASCGCLVGHVCLGVRFSVFAPYLCNTSVSGLDEYANGCLFKKGADWYPFCLGGGTGRGVWGGGCQGGPAQKSYVPIQNFIFWSLLIWSLFFVMTCSTVLVSNIKTVKVHSA